LDGDNQFSPDDWDFRGCVFISVQLLENIETDKTGQKNLEKEAK